MYYCEGELVREKVALSKKNTFKTDKVFRITDLGSDDYIFFLLLFLTQTYFLFVIYNENIRKK